MYQKGSKRKQIKYKKEKSMRKKIMCVTWTSFLAKDEPWTIGKA